MDLRELPFHQPYLSPHGYPPGRKRTPSPGSTAAVALPVGAGGEAHGANEFAGKVAVIVEADFKRNGGDGGAGFDKHLAGFADAELADVGGERELKAWVPSGT